MAPELDARCAFTVQQLQHRPCGNTKQKVFTGTMGGLFMGNENKRCIPSSTCNYCYIQFNARSKWLASLVFSAVRIRSDITCSYHQSRMMAGFHYTDCP